MTSRIEGDMTETATCQTNDKETVPRETEASGDDEADTSLDMTAVAALTSLAASPGLSSASEERSEKETFTIPQRFTRSGRKRAVSFPLKLMKVLSMQEYSGIIAWAPSGKSFQILDAKRFVAEVLPLHFKSAKYSSFTRKLHRWGFARLYRGEDSGAFFHKDFQRGAGGLVEKMTCYRQEPTRDVSQALLPPQEESSVHSKPIRDVTKNLHGKVGSGAPKARPEASYESATSHTVQTSQSPPISAPTVRNTEVDITAAIEIEVARRVQERLSSEALRLRALEIIKKEQERKLSMILNPRMPLSRPASHLSWSLQGINLLKNSQQFGRSTYPQVTIKKQDAHPLLHFRTQTSDTHSLPGLPRTNIQGAKTA